MAVNVEVTKKKNESNASIIKRFTRKVQESGVLPRVRSIRYEERQPSDYTKKKKRLKSLIKKAEFEKLYKLGKISGYGKGAKRK
jgi:ribosomal protein S21